VLFNPLYSNSGDNFGLALTVTSAIFGFAHEPVFGASALIEAILGGAFGFAYYYSHFNLFVPILVHFLYDFWTFYFVWKGGRGKYLAQFKTEMMQKYAEFSVPNLQKKVNMLPAEISKAVKKNELFFEISLVFLLMIYNN
jgi:hypothetical protein